jgi:hypothetical protein
MTHHTQHSVAVFGSSFRRTRRPADNRTAFMLVRPGVREAGVEPAPPKGPGPKPGVSTVPPLARRLEVSVMSSEDIVRMRSFVQDGRGVQPNCSSWPSPTSPRMCRARV